MIQTTLLVLVMFFQPPQPNARDGIAFALEPDYSTLQIYGDGPRGYVECGEWPIKPYQPRAFNLRGQVFSNGDLVGRYYARGWIRQSDGAHVADYAIEFRSVGTILFSIDALPDVDAAEFSGFVLNGTRRNEPFQLTFKPRRSTDCVWGMGWEGNLQIN